jgi:hypothetical protein
MEETALDRAAMERLAKALVFICGPLEEKAPVMAGGELREAAAPSSCAQ